MWMRELVCRVNDVGEHGNNGVMGGRGLIRWFKNKNYPTEMNNEQHLKISREFSRENRKISRFPGKFPGKTENLIVFPGKFPGKTKKYYFPGKFPGKIEKFIIFRGNFPGKVNKFIQNCIEIRWIV